MEHNEKEEWHLVVVEGGGRGANICRRGLRREAEHGFLKEEQQRYVPHYGDGEI